MIVQAYNKEIARAPHTKSHWSYILIKIPQTFVIKEYIFVSLGFNKLSHTNRSIFWGPYEPRAFFVCWIVVKCFPCAFHSWTPDDRQFVYIFETYLDIRCKHWVAHLAQSRSNYPVEPGSFISIISKDWVRVVTNVLEVPPLFQTTTCRLDRAKPLSEPMLTYCQLDPKQHIPMKFDLKFKNYHSRKCVWTCRLWNGGHFVRMCVCVCVCGGGGGGGGTPYELNYFELRYAKVNVFAFYNNISAYRDGACSLNCSSWKIMTTYPSGEFFALIGLRMWRMYDSVQMVPIRFGPKG